MLFLSSIHWGIPFALFMASISLYVLFRKVSKEKNALEKELGKPFEIDESFIGQHFLVFNFYEKKQWPGTYDGNIWLLEATVENMPGKHFFKITNEQYEGLKGGYEGLYKLRSWGNPKKVFGLRRLPETVHRNMHCKVRRCEISKRYLLSGQ